MSWSKFKKAHDEANRLFYNNVVPKLPVDMQEELRIANGYVITWEGESPVKIMLSVNEKRFDMTEWYVPGQTIFDVYEHE